jgi:hypothetical protein
VYMNYITSTQLRTKSSDFIETLLRGEEVNLIHRSKHLGKIKLIKEEELKVFDAEGFAKIANKMNLPKLSLKEREERYRKAMEKKHA